MKKILGIAALLFMVASLVWAWTPGRDNQPVTISSTSNSMLSDTVYMDSMAVNPYSESTKALTGVKQIRIKAQSAIDVRVAFGTGSSTATTYALIASGSELYIRDLNGISITVAALGNGTTSDTGTIGITYCK